MKAFKNKTVVTVLSVIICFAILAVAYTYRVNKKINAITVPIAKMEILAREQITEDKIGTTKIAGSALTPNIYRNIDDIKNKYVNFNTKIPEGSFFYSNAVVEWSSMPDSAWSDINDDNTIVSLSVNNEITFGNSIYPNDKIDIYYQTYDGTQLVLGKLIEGITVLAVKDSSGYHIGQKSATQKDAVALIFSVSEDLHLLLRKAIYLDGNRSLIVVPRNTAYSQSQIQTNISSSYLVSLINNRCKDVPLDSVSNANNNSISIGQ